MAWQFMCCTRTWQLMSFFLAASILLISPFPPAIAGENKRGVINGLAKVVNRPGAYAPHIAILPFRNLSESESARDLVMPMIYREMERIGFAPVPDTLVESILRKYRIRDTGQIDSVDLEHIVESTGAEYVLLGSIDVFEDNMLQGVLTLQIVSRQVAFSARLLNAKKVVHQHSGEILWANSVSSSSDDQVRILGIKKKQSMEDFAEHEIRQLLGSLMEWVQCRGVQLNTPSGVLSAPVIASAAKQSPTSIAIIPFANSTDRRIADQIVYNIFLSALVNKGYRVIEPGMVISQLRLNQVRSPGELDLQTLKTIAESFKVTYCLTGSVLRWCTSTRFRDVAEEDETVVPEMQISARLIDPSTGKLVWAKLLERSGDDHFGILGLGVVHSSSKLAKSLMDELVLGISY
jgi:hypothetical protein